jgi:hypothetical protein
LNETRAIVDEKPRSLDPAELALVMERLRSEQNLGLGTLAGVGAAAAGAAAWALVTVLSHYQIGWMAVGVGFLVGLAVRTLGKGVDRVFGIVGGALALAGCLAGNLLAACGLVAQQEGLSYLGILGQLDTQSIQELMVATFTPMDLLFYGIAVYEGYKLSLRQLSPEELSKRVTG